MRVLALLVLGAVVLAAPPARAHVPHDVTTVVAVSPDFASDQTVFAAFSLIDHRVFGRSTDGGRRWSIWGPDFAQRRVTRFVFSPEWATDGTAFASTFSGGVYRTTDRGLTWTPTNTGLTQLFCLDLAVSPHFATDQALIVATRTGAFRSTDGGDSWAPADVGLLDGKVDAVAFSPPVSGVVSAFIAGKTVHRSDDLGANWAPLQTFTGNVRAIAVSPAFELDGTVAIAVNNEGPHVSGDGGATWAPATAGLVDLSMEDLVFTPSGGLFLATDDRVYRAASPFATWEEKTLGLEALDPVGSPHYSSLAVSPDHTNDGTVLLAAFEGLFRSVDDAELWDGMRVSTQDYVYRLAAPPGVGGGRVYAATSGAGVLSWRDPLAPVAHAPTVTRGTRSASTPGAGGVSGLGGPAPDPVEPLGPPPPGAADLGWDVRSDRLASLWSNGLVASPDFAQDDTLFYAYVGLWRSTDRGRSWQQVAVDPSVQVVRDVAFSPDFAADRTLLLSTSNVGVWRSTDGGDTWSLLGGGLPPGSRGRRMLFSPDFASDQTAFAATRSAAMWRTVDGGDTWTNVSAGIDGNVMMNMAISPDFAGDDTLLASELGGPLYLSTDRGESWAATDVGLSASAGQVVLGIAFSPDYAVDGRIVATSADGGVYCSDDRAASWTLVHQIEAGMATDVLLRPTLQGPVRMTLSAPPGLLVGELDAPCDLQAVPFLFREDDLHPQVTRTGFGWSSAFLDGVHGVGISQNAGAGAAMQSTFYGREVAVLGQRGPEAPIVDVLIDGVPVAQVDLYDPLQENQAEIFRTSFEDADWRTIEVSHTGLTNPSATGQVMRLDGFLYLR